MRTFDMVNSCCLGICPSVSHVPLVVIIVVIIFGGYSVAPSKAARIMTALADMITAAQAVVQATLD